MMATEVTSEDFADATNRAETDQTTINTSQDVANEIPRVNGEFRSDESKSYTEFADGIANSAEVSVSGGSDTEAAKAETSKSQTDEKGHFRTTSTVKKPTTFKAVSVNKTFLAAKGATPVKLGDKGATGSTSLPAAPLTSSTPRPRLVAKSGSGLRDSAPRTATTPNGGKAGAAPDANAVWNKNRPAPPPEQKRITDEELKQQYGIHLATRLQTDDPSRQANWADIDDDDDDWAPETIEWTDGTKITLPQAEEVVPSSAKATIVTTVSETASTEPPKSKSPVPATSTSTTTTTTTAKLGGISSGSGKGLILKGAAEKPTLVAKPPGPPAPVKSPWAQLPPVDKTAPIAAELQQIHPQQPSRFSQRDPHSFDNMPPPPAKEIAADDFSRSWREGGSNNKELFNSQSGRYEPVRDSQKGSSRNDMHSRQPALLQRPSQQDQQGPAEPSPAFQTHRATGQDSSYGRRRTSSTVSGGSGNLVRRMSKGQDIHAPHEMLHNRRGSLVAVTDSPSSPNVPSSSLHQPNQRGYQQQQWPGRASPSLSHDSPASAQGQMVTSVGAHPTASSIPFEDEVELQKKIMRESRELARKRRLEEEAREEAERKERIRLKLEAMGPAPESKKSKKDSSKEEKTMPTQIQARDGVSTSTSPPKPPVAEYPGEIKQYGMMKVHPPDPVTAEAKVIKDDVRPPQDIRSNGIHSSTASNAGAESQQAPNDARQTQTWQNSAPSGTDRYPPWGSPATHPSQGRNVWGPPTNDRTLGNGTFNPDLSRLPEVHSSQPSQMAGSGPGPIGPPNSNRMNGQYQGRTREQFGQRPGPIGPPQRQQALTREQQRAQANSAWNSLPEKLAQEDARAREEQEKQDAARLELQAAGVDTSQPQPVYKDTWKQVGVAEDGTRSVIKSVSQTINDGTNSTASSAWNEFPSQPAQEEGPDRTRFEQQQENTWRQMELNVVKMDISQPVYKDSWRHVQLENGIRSDILGSTVNNGSSSTASPPVRGSRFFPQSKDVRVDDSTASFTRPGSPSPPPPTMAGHPAYDGDIAHPQVSLPRPPPVVRLPPPRVLAPIGPPKPATSFAAAVATSVAPVAPVASPSNATLSYQPRQQDDGGKYRNDQMGPARTSHGTSSAGDWQDRINHLIGRRSSPQKSHALAVDSSSKSALELPTAQKSATVSLPNSTSGDTSDEESLFETKPMAEECFEEQEMGSLPPIRVPNKAPEAAWTLALPQNKPLPRKFVLSQVTSADPLSFLAQVGKDGTTVHIFLPGMTEEKTATVPHKTEPRQKSNSRRGPPRGSAPRHASSSHPRGSRTRDSSSGFPSPGLEHSSISPSPTSSNRGGTRGRGAFGSHWNNNRHVSTPNNAINV